MKTVAKVAIMNGNNEYLLLRRSNHPMYPGDADLPGGLVEPAESPVEGALREVIEETGLRLDAADLREIYAGTEYSLSGSMQYLYTAKVDTALAITLSWEHDLFEWLDEVAFIEKAKNAKDTYMHIVHDVLR